MTRTHLTNRQPHSSWELTKKGYLLAVIALSLALLALTGCGVPAEAHYRPGYDATQVVVVLRAASGMTIPFLTQNGKTVNGILPEMKEMPRLVLHRNGALTEPSERTLILEVSGIQVPPSGVTVTLQIETMHENPDPEMDSNITVWRASQVISNSPTITEAGVTAPFTHTFGEMVDSPTGPVATPTDYFRYNVMVIPAQDVATNPAVALQSDHAFLMENQWAALLPDVAETTEGAAPDEMLVYYCDMFPFRRVASDCSTWLPREAVTDYVGSELLPQMVEAFRVQTDEWGFPWHDEWTGFRSEGDKERLSVALSDGGTWFHGAAPSQGHAGISINTAAGKNALYGSLTDGLMSCFHHELFHNLQRNIQQSLGPSGDVDGQNDAWQFFTEGTAVAVVSVAQPVTERSQAARARAHMHDANSYLGTYSPGGDLNTSYETMNPYHAALYWRFLYEGCGGTESPIAGMDIIKRALTALYAGDVVDIASSTDLVQHIPAIMDQAFADASCPFGSYEESLVAFTRAIYALRLEGGRCVAPGTPHGCGFYDPGLLYRDPPVSEIVYAAETITYAPQEQPRPVGIPSSFGVDFVDVLLNPAADGQALTLEVRGIPGAAAEFVVEVHKLMDPGGHGRPRPVSSQANAPETLVPANADGVLSYVIPAVDTSVYNRLGLIITRVDAMESSDPIGEYTISFTH
jgi:hypothetical protein